MPCPDCEKLLAELDALKAELVAACVKVVEEQQRPILEQLDRVVADFEQKYRALVALADRHMLDSLARLSRLEEAVMRRLPRGEPPSEPPARH
jgi:primosomal protein N''